MNVKIDFYIKDWKFNKLVLEKDKLIVIPKNIDVSLMIIATNTEKFSGHRYVIILAVSKNDIKN